MIFVQPTQISNLMFGSWTTPVGAFFTLTLAHHAMRTAAAAALAVAVALSGLTWGVVAMDFGVPALGSQSGEPGFLIVKWKVVQGRGKDCPKNKQTKSVRLFFCGRNLYMNCQDTMVQALLTKLFRFMLALASSPKHSDILKFGNNQLQQTCGISPQLRILVQNEGYKGSLYIIQRGQRLRIIINHDSQHSQLYNLTLWLGFCTVQQYYSWTSDQRFVVTVVYLALTPQYSADTTANLGNLHGLRTAA